MKGNANESQLGLMPLSHTQLAEIIPELDTWHSSQTVATIKLIQTHTAWKLHPLFNAKYDSSELLEINFRWILGRF